MKGIGFILSLALVATIAQGFKVSFFSDSNCETSFMSHCGEDCGRIGLVEYQNVNSIIDFVKPDDVILTDTGEKANWDTAAANVQENTDIILLKTLSITNPSNDCSNAAISAGPDGEGDVERSVALVVDFTSFDITIFKGTPNCEDAESSVNFSVELDTENETSITIGTSDDKESGFSSACTLTDANFIKEWFKAFHLTSEYSSRDKPSEIEATNAWFLENDEEVMAYIKVELNSPVNDIVKLNGPGATNADLEGHWVEGPAKAEMIANGFMVEDEN